jgi:preprotein translocase subunit YajC
MESLIVVAVTFALLWFLFIRPQQRRVREHNALVASVQPGDEVVLSAGIYGRIVELGPDELTLEVAPGVELRVARQAILRRAEPSAMPRDTGSDAGPTDRPESDTGVDPPGPDAGPTPGSTPGSMP